MKFLTLLLFSFTSVQVVAQEVKKLRTCRVFFVDKPNNAPAEAFFYDGKQSRKILLPSLNLSEVIDLPPGDIVLGFSPKAVLEGEILPPGAPIAKIPAQYSNIYLLLFRDLKNKILPFKIKVINIDSFKLKKGQTLWINMTKYQIAAKTGDSSFLIPASKLKVADSPLKNHGFYLAQFAYRLDPKKSFLPVMRKNWWFDSSCKHLGFVIDKGTKMPKIFTLRDRRLPKPEVPREK